MLKESLGIGPSKCAPAHGSKNSSHEARTRISWVKAKYPDHLD